MTMTKTAAQSNPHKSTNGKNRKKGRKHVKKKKHGQKKFIRTVANIDTMIESGRTTVADDVKKLIKAMESGIPMEELNSEILRLHHVIVDGHMQDLVIEKCGKNDLLLVLKKARNLRKKDEKQQKHTLPGINTDRHKWLKWFRGKFGINGEMYMTEEVYEAIQIAASSVDFTELLTNSKTISQFYQNGLAECYKIAERENFYQSPPKKRVLKNYVTKSSPHVTRKEWGSLYKPARG